MLEQFDPVLLCPDCEVVRTDRSRHCSYCNRCVERFDHHCPWINNCVGTGNHGPFSFFIVSMYALLVSTACVIGRHPECDKNRYDTNEANYLIPKLLPIEMYKPEIVYPIMYLCLGVCILFALPVT